MKRALICFILLALPAFAQPQQDEAIPYDDDVRADDSPIIDATSKKKKKKKKNVSDERLREDEDDARTRDETMTHVDDPNTGLGVEVFAGLLLLESSRGVGVYPLFSGGVRATWEFGRLIPDEFLREMFFADVQWQFAQSTDGTTQVHATSAQHYFTVAPAVAIPLGNKSPIAAYAQLGAGFNANFTTVVVDEVSTPITGGKFLFQYGIGLRGRPAVVDDGTVRITFRIELTRFLRGYMSDTFIGAGVGVLF